MIRLIRNLFKYLSKYILVKKYFYKQYQEISFDKVFYKQNLK